MLQNLSVGLAIASLGYTLGTDADPVMSYQVESAFVNATVGHSSFATPASGCASAYHKAHQLAAEPKFVCMQLSLSCKCMSI